MRQLERLPVLWWVADRRGVCQRLGPRWATVLERSVSHLEATGWGALFHPDDLERFTTLLMDRVLAREPLEIELRVRDRRRGDRWMSARAEPTADGGMVGLCIDVTQRRASRERLRSTRALLETVVGRAPVGFALIDSRGRLVRANRAFAAMAAVDESRQVGRRLEAIWPGGPPERGRAALARVLATGEPLDGVVLAGVGTVGRPARHWLTSWYPVPVGEENAAVGLYATDISDRVRAEQGLWLVSRVGEALDEALGVEERLGRLATVLVPAMADFCTIHLVGPFGRLEHVAQRHRDTTTVRRPAGERPKATPARGWPPAAEEAMRTRRAVVIGDPGEAAAHAPDEVAMRLGVDALEVESLAIVPLVAHGGARGVLCLGMAGSGRRYSDADTNLLGVLARRCGLALDNARLYDDQRRIAVTLQRSLLPPALPRAPGIDTAARYVPMGAGNEVGGDFYDMFAVGDSWGVVVGDVCGKGPAAAALTATLRHGVRTLALADPPPARLLGDLNELLVAERGLTSRFSTALYVRLDPRPDGRVRVRVASAGHPLPLVVRRGGGVEQIGRPGTLLGSLAQVRLHETSTILEPGDLLMVFTDGLTEARAAGELFGDRRMGEVLGGLAGAGAERVAATIENAVRAFSPGPLRDDMALVVVRAGSECEESE